MVKTAKLDAAKVLLDRGFSIAEAARLVGIHRHTVAKVKRPESTLILRRRFSPLDAAPFHSLIKREMAGGNVTCTGLFDILTRAGFTGSLRTLQRYVRRSSDAFFDSAGPSSTSWGRWLTSTDHGWMLQLAQANFSTNALANHLGDKLEPGEIEHILDVIREGRLADRNRIVAITANLKGVETRFIAEFLGISTRSINEYIRRFSEKRFEGLLPLPRKSTTKAADPRYSDPLFKVLHAPPSTYGINRSTWTMFDLKRVMSSLGLKISVFNIRQVIRRAGYHFRKAKVVLTSHDPMYHEKLTRITSILKDLQPDEKFFSVDEFGPLAIRLRGGISLQAPGESKAIPQHQKSKGQLIVTAALELSTNQISHFFRPRRTRQK